MALDMLFADFKFHAMFSVEVTSCLLDIGSIKSPRCIISTFFSFIKRRGVEVLAWPAKRNCDKRIKFYLPLYCITGGIQYFRSL